MHVKEIGLLRTSEGYIFTEGRCHQPPSSPNFHSLVHEASCILLTHRYSGYRPDLVFCVDMEVPLLVV